jgi:hypothetical protein
MRTSTFSAGTPLPIDELVRGGLAFAEDVAVVRVGTDGGTPFGVQAVTERRGLTVKALAGEF